MKGEPEQRLLDLSQYQDRNQALALAAHGCPKAYTEVAKTHMAGQQQISVNFMLFGSFVSRLRGLHEGVVGGLQNDNPHAVFPLIRAWMETVTIGLYTLRNPRYVEQLLYGPGNNRPARKTFASMFHAVREDASQLKLVYKDLSDYSHFGTLGVWNAHAIDDDQDRIVTWTDAPRWKSQTEFQIACAQADELAVAGLQTLGRLGELLIPGAKRGGKQ